MSSELSKEASELVREGQVALRPAAADKSRVALALQAKLQATEQAPEPTPEASPKVSPATTSVPGMGKVLALTSGLVLSVAVVSYLLSRSPERASEPDVRPNVAAATIATNPAPLVVPGVSSVERGADQPEPAPLAPAIAALGPQTNGKPLARTPASDRLAEEALLLSEAEKAFHAGNFKRALALTQQHRTKFPNGLLARERVHLRVQALCGLGRQDDADKELARLTKLGGSATIKACGRTP